MIRWGYYTRQALPLFKFIHIQRVRCKHCGGTTNVLPSFLLAHKSHSVKTLEEMILSFVNDPDNWKQFLDSSIDLSKAYRWLRIMVKQANEVLPDIRKELLKLAPEHRVMDPEPEPFPSNRIILKRLLAHGKQLFKAAVRLVDEKEPPGGELFSFLNYFLAKQSGKPLLVL